MIDEREGGEVKIVTLLSGGMDSAVLLYQQENCQQIALTIDYGQSHVREIESASNLCKSLGVKHLIVKVEGLSGGYLMSREGQTSGSNTVVPSRNGIMINIAANIAAAMGCSRVSIGCNKNDHDVYMDCRRGYLESVGNSIAISTGVRLHYPFLSMSKREIRLLGNSLGVPFEETWSCYSGLDTPCGACGACIEVRGSLEVSN
jgi:7-cyano-7-deazaguanine synthase